MIRIRSLDLYDVLSLSGTSVSWCVGYDMWKKTECLISYKQMC